MRQNRLGLALIAVCFGVASSADLYVSPTGNDANPGTIKKPFRTLERARDEANRLLRLGRVAVNRKFNIYLRQGSYLRATPFVVSPTPKLPQGVRLVYQSYPGEQATLTGATRIAGWKRDASHPFIWKAPIPKGWRFHYLMVDGKPQQIARMVKSDNWTTWPKPVQVGKVEKAGQLLTVLPGQLEDLPNNGDLEMNLMPVNFWNTLSIIRDIDPQANTLRRHSKSPTQCGPKDRFPSEAGNYNLQNALKFLTEPGEWCVDSKTGVVYYWPRDGQMEGKSVWAPHAYRLIEVKGVSGKPVRGIEFRNLTFTCTDRLPEDQWPDDWIKRQAELPDAMVVFDGATNCRVERCRFVYSGSYSVALMNRTDHVRIAGNEMGYSGCGGVLLQGYGPGKTLVNHSNIIHRNYIHHTGNGGYMHSAAITLYQSGKNEITLNWIAEVPYVGIQIAGCRPDEFGPGTFDGSEIWDSYGNNQAMYGVRWSQLPRGRASKFTRESFKTYLQSINNYISCNILVNYMNRLHDGGALYCWGCGNGNFWEGNLLWRDNTTPGEIWCFALYMDDFVDGATIKDNIAWHKGVPTINKGENKWVNNIVSADKPEGFDARMEQLISGAMQEGGWLGLKFNKVP